MGTEKEFIVANIYVENKFTEDIKEFKNNIADKELLIMKRILKIIDIESTHSYDESMR
jgi:hypothetical protein